MPILPTVSALAVVFLLTAVCMHVYVRRKPSVQAARRWELERRRRAVLEDFGDVGVWRMGQRVTQAPGNATTQGQALTRRGFLPRMAGSLFILMARRRASPAVLGMLLREQPPSEQADSVTYQGVTLQPGDVVNFYGGIFTTGGFLTYGHSALYLGIDPQTNERSFLDFTTSKANERAFVGRILPEREFLATSAKYHQSFDVFRLRDRSILDQRKLVQEAKRVAIPKNKFFFSEVCSTAVAEVLSKASGSHITARTPDDFVGGAFQRHPQLSGKSINIQAAIRDAENRNYHDSPPPHAHGDSPHGDHSDLAEFADFDRADAEG